MLGQISNASRPSWMYYKSPEIAPLAQPANPLEGRGDHRRGDRTGAGAPAGGAPAGTAMPTEDLAGVVARGAGVAAATGAARAGTAGAAPAMRGAATGAGAAPAARQAMSTSPPRSRRALAGAGVDDGGHPRVSSVRVGRERIFLRFLRVAVEVCSLLLEPSSKAAGGGGGGVWSCRREAWSRTLPYPAKVRTRYPGTVGSLF